MKTYHHFHISYSDVDASRHVRLSDLERYLLETAGESADILGFGTRTILDQYNSAWVLTRLTVEMDYLPFYKEDIEVETWVESNAHMLSVRNFRIYLIDGEQKRLIGRSTSVWTILNLETRQIDSRIFSSDCWEGKIDGEPLRFTRAQRLGKIEQPTAARTRIVSYSDLDFNNHCNSCKYLGFMLDTDSSLCGVSPIRIDINYAKEVHLGQEISVAALSAEDGIRYAILTPEGDISCTAMISHL